MKKELKQLSNYLPIVTKKSIYGIWLDSVLYFESDLRKIRAVTGPSREDAYVFYNKLSDLAPLLPSNFIQCHRSFIVNMKQVHKLEERHFVLKEGVQISISRSHYADTKLGYRKFLLS